MNSSCEYLFKYILIGDSGKLSINILGVKVLEKLVFCINLLNINQDIKKNQL